jgi:hypothetical protein
MIQREIWQWIFLHQGKSRAGNIFGRQPMNDKQGVNKAPRKCCLTGAKIPRQSDNIAGSDQRCKTRGKDLRVSGIGQRHRNRTLGFLRHHHRLLVKAMDESRNHRPAPDGDADRSRCASQYRIQALAW